MMVGEIPARPALVGRRPVLVTGGAGFIGSNLADRLAREGHDVLVYDALARPGVETNLSWLKSRHPQRISSVTADIRDAQGVAEATRDAKAVFHFAAQVAVTTSLVAPREDFDTNVQGTLHLLEALRLRKEPVPLLFASTNKVYGDLGDVDLEETNDAYVPRDPAVRANGIGEDRPLDFHTPYGCSKGAADQYVLDYARSFGIPTAVMRMSCIYGPRQMGTEDQGWVAHFLIRALEGQPISIYGDGRQVRDVLNVADAIEAYLAAWTRIDAVQGRAFNVGGGPANAVSLRQLLRYIEDLIGEPVDLTFSAWRAGDQRYYVSDMRRAARELDLRAPIPWRTGVAALARWLADERGLKTPPSHPAARPQAAGLCREAFGVPAGVTRRRPMRLLMTTDAVGGVWPYASDLARGLAERQVETTLVVLGPAPAAEALESVLAIPGLRVVITGLPLDWTAATAEEVAEAAEHVAAIASDIRAAVVHLNSPALAALASFTAPVVGVCHSCLATWWDAIRSGPLPSDFVWRARMVEQGYRACDALAAPTAAFARITAATYRITEPRVVRNGRRDRSIERAVKPADVVFTAGRLWDEGKNLATLDAAAARLGVPVLAAGPVTGPNGSAISLRHIRSVGSLDESEIREWLGQQPIFASVPRYEPFGLAILEAAQAGCALVLSDIPTLRELWDGAAVFVAPHDQMALAGAIEALAQDRARRESLGDAARKCAERYSVERMTAGMLDLYEAVLARDAVRPREAVA